MSKREEIVSLVRDIKLLTRDIEVTERSTSYTFHWKEKVVTLHSANRILNQLIYNLKQLIGMKLQEAKKEAVKESKAQPRKIIFVSVDSKGDCDITTSFKADSCLHAYKNGSEIALPSATPVSTKGKEKSNNQNSKEMATASKNPAKKTAQKSNAKPTKESKDRTPVKGKVQELTLKQIADLFAKGNKIMTETGGVYNKAYIDKGDKKSDRLRRVIVTKE